MLELHKLEQTDFELFKSWIKNKDELMQFAAPAIFAVSYHRRTAEKIHYR